MDMGHYYGPFLRNQKSEKSGLSSEDSLESTMGDLMKFFCCNEELK